MTIQDVQDDNSQLVSACGGLSRAMAEMVNSVHSVQVGIQFCSFVVWCWLTSQVAKRGKDSTEGDTLVNTFFKKVCGCVPVIAEFWYWKFTAVKQFSHDYLGDNRCTRTTQEGCPWRKAQPFSHAPQEVDRYGCYVSYLFGLRRILRGWVLNWNK